MQGIAPLPLSHAAWSDLHSTVSLAFQCFISSFSGASAPSTPVDGQPWYDSTNHTQNVRINGTWQTLLIKALANVGTTALAVATGDFAAGKSDGNQIFWDESTGTLELWPTGAAGELVSLAVSATGGSLSMGLGGSDLMTLTENALSFASSAGTRIAIDGDDGHARVGSATDTATLGDFVAGIVAAARFFYDQSAAAGYLFDSSGNQKIKLDAAGELAIVGTSGGLRTEVGNQGIACYDSGGTLVHSLLSGSNSELNATRIDIDLIVNGNDREAFRVNAGNNGIEVSWMTHKTSSATIDSGGSLTVTTANVIVTGFGGGSADDDLVTIVAGTGIAFQDGDRLLLHTAHDDGEITLKHATGNIYVNTDQIMLARSSMVELIYVAAISKWCGVGVRPDNE